MKKLYITTKCEKGGLHIGHILAVFINFRSSSKFLILEILVNSPDGNLKI